MFGYEIDLESPPEIVRLVAGYALQVWDLAGTWLLSPPAWMQFALLIAGSLLFWLGRWSNQQSSAFVSKQMEMRPTTREPVIKAAEIAVYCIAFILLMNITGVNLSTLTVLGGAIGVGLGYGLQKIASTFISGVIPLLEGQAMVGDDVELGGEKAGTIVERTARAAILEIFDGRWFLASNEDFIPARVVKFSDSSGIEIPCPLRMVELKGGPLGSAA